MTNNSINKDELIDILKQNVAIKQDLIDRLIEENVLLWEKVVENYERKGNWE